MEKEVDTLATEGKSKKLIVYQDKKSGAFFLRSTRVKEGKYKIKPAEFGKALGPSASDSELGKWTRKILEYCD